MDQLDHGAEGPISRTAHANRNLVWLIADRGHGRMFMIDDFAELPALFVREVGPGR